MPKSIIINKHGGPEVLELVDVKVGTPGPNDIKIKNLAIGLNFIDTYHRSGLYPLKLPSPIGMEGAGIIEEVGSAVKNFSKGDKVTYASPPSNESIPPGSYLSRQVRNHVIQVNPIPPSPGPFCQVQIHPAKSISIPSGLHAGTGHR